MLQSEAEESNRSLKTAQFLYLRVLDLNRTWYLAKGSWFWALIGLSTPSKNKTAVLFDDFNCTRGSTLTQTHGYLKSTGGSTKQCTAVKSYDLNSAGVSITVSDDMRCTGIFGNCGAISLAFKAMAP